MDRQAIQEGAEALGRYEVVRTYPRGLLDMLALTTTNNHHDHHTDPETSARLVRRFMAPMKRSGFDHARSSPADEEDAGGGAGVLRP